MKNKTLVISGGTRGIGKSIVYAFASKGINVALITNKKVEELSPLEQVMLTEVWQWKYKV